MLRIGHPAFSTRRSHEAPRWGGRPGSGAGDEASRTGGRKRSVIRIRSVERREAQRLGGKASQTFRSPPRAPRDGPRKPVLARCAATARAGLASLRLPTRGLANPWRLPALHSPFGETEKGTGGARAETNNRAAQRWLSLVVIARESGQPSKHRTYCERSVYWIPRLRGV